MESALKAFHVFGSTTLNEMVNSKSKTKAELLDVKGIEERHDCRSYQNRIPIFFSQSILLSSPVVKNKNAHNATQIFRQFLASALLIVVLLSSCSVKRGVKVLFDMPLKMEQVGALGHYISSADQSETACVKSADLQVITADSHDHSLLKNLSSAIFISVVFSLLLLPFFRPEEEQNYKLPTLGRSIPKYLLFSKLLFYDIR